MRVTFHHTHRRLICKLAGCGSLRGSLLQIGALELPILIIYQPKCLNRQKAPMFSSLFCRGDAAAQGGSEDARVKETFSDGEAALSYMATGGAKGSRRLLPLRPNAKAARTYRRAYFLAAVHGCDTFNRCLLEMTQNGSFPHPHPHPFSKRANVVSQCGIIFFF